jgi:transposase
MRKAAHVRLTPEERADLTERLEREALNGRRRRHFQIVLLADEGHTDPQIAAATGAGRSTVERVRQRFAREGLGAALNDKPRSGAPPQFDGKQEAMIIALAGSDAPEGRTCWTAELLANRAVALGVAESISETTVRRILKKTDRACGRSGPALSYPLNGGRPCPLRTSARMRSCSAASTGATSGR